MNHLQALESYRNASAIRQTVLECSEQQLVDGRRILPGIPALVIILQEASPLFVSVRQFHVAIGKFQRTVKYFKPIGDTRIARTHPR
jgi:hypothetical protein